MTTAVAKPPKGIIGWLARLTDFVNPILVKETRQALKSRQFVATFMLLLIASWIISSFLLLNAGDELEFRAVGRMFFFGYNIVLTVAVLAIVPFNAFRSLQAERELDTYDLLSITAMSPRQMVLGKLLSAVVQTLLFFSAITPFIAFASLLQGFELFSSLFLLLVTLVQSIFLSMVALMLSSFAKNRQWQGLLAVMLLGSLFWLTIVNVMSSLQVLRGGVTFTSDFWIAFGIIALSAASYFWLFLQIATAQMTFESDNRSSGIRFTFSLQCILFWAIVFVVWSYRSTLAIPPRVLNVIFESVGFVALIYVTAVGLVFATEGDFLSRRVRRTIPRNFLLKSISVPYWPGGSRGLVYHLLHLAVTLAAILFLFGLRGATADIDWWTHLKTTVELGPEKWPLVWNWMSVMMLYSVIFVGLISLVSRTVLAMVSIVRPAHMRVVGVLIVAASLLFPMVLEAMEVIRPNTFSFTHFTNPYMLMFHGVLTESLELSTAITVLGIAALVIVLLNSLAMSRSVLEILRAKKQARQIPVLVEGSV